MKPTGSCAKYGRRQDFRLGPNIDCMLSHQNACGRIIATNFFLLGVTPLAPPCMATSLNDSLMRD